MGTLGKLEKARMSLCQTVNLSDRFYTQITGEKARQLSAARSSRRNASDVGATRIDDHGITADEVLEQLNKIMTPWKVEFASAMSWFAVWRGNFHIREEIEDGD